MNILIPNATSPKNIGDYAMLKSLVSLLRKDANVKIHSTESQLYRDNFKHIVSPTLYSWAVFENRNLLMRFVRVTELMLNYFLFKNFRTTFATIDLRSLIKDYENADLIIFVGGGYLRSQKGITQALNVLMTVILFQFAKVTKAQKIIAPISFGPFAYKWQESYAALTLKDFGLVVVREKYSYELLRKYNIKNLILSTDIALLLKQKKEKKRKKNGQFVLGFTIRKWLPLKKQKKFEKEFLDSIVSFSKSTDAIVQPIIQVDAPEYGDNDYELTEELLLKIKSEGVMVKPVVKIKDLDGSAGIYGQIDLLLGMRMHSNILAALYGTPFVAIAYEHKMEGIAEYLGLKEYCIKIEIANKRTILSKLRKAYKNKQNLTKILENFILKTRLKETRKLKLLFNQSYSDKMEVII